ncbi:MAG: hypothetical protein IKN24_03155 [Lachnospiraceae bacterium]|nr:hypothetical protein [Lachnospiraceae bacterium]
MANTAFEDEKYVRRDRMRYEKNTMSSRLAIIAIVLNALFFVSIYKSNVGNYYYTIKIGVSIVYNLLFMMFVFLVAEGSKNYNVAYSYLAIPFGIMQFVRIFIIPAKAHAATTLVASGDEVQVMGDAQYTRVMIYLVVSGACLLISAAVGIWKCGVLKKHLAQLAENK